MYRVIDVAPEGEKLVSETDSYMTARRAYSDASYAKFREMSSGQEGSIKLLEGVNVKEEQDRDTWLNSKRKAKGGHSGSKKRQKKKTDTLTATTAAKKPARVSLDGCEELGSRAEKLGSPATAWQKLEEKEASKVKESPLAGILRAKEMQGAVDSML